MKLLTVRDDLCIKCGMCIEVCACKVIAMGENGPEERYSARCMGCGHCVAICPKAALDNVKSPLADEAATNDFQVLPPKTAAAFLKARRSIRKYKKETVSQEKMRKLLDIARFAPTAANSQGLSYIVVDKPEILKKITQVTIAWFEAEINAGTPWIQGFAGLVKRYKSTGEDLILWNAPNVIVATAPKSLRSGHDNARLSLEYAELYAPSLGLGTCWASFAEMCAEARFPDLLELLEIPEDMAVVGIMIAGYPKLTYRRPVSRNPLKITWL